MCEKKNPPLDTAEIAMTAVAAEIAIAEVATETEAIAIAEVAIATEATAIAEVAIDTTRAIETIPVTETATTAVTATEVANATAMIAPEETNNAHKHQKMTQGHSKTHTAQGWKHLRGCRHSNRHHNQLHKLPNSP
jgi:hypothetical protein